MVNVRKIKVHICRSDNDIIEPLELARQIWKADGPETEAGVKYCCIYKKHLQKHWGWETFGGISDTSKSAFK